MSLARGFRRLLLSSIFIKRESLARPFRRASIVRSLRSKTLGGPVRTGDCASASLLTLVQCDILRPTLCLLSHARPLEPENLEPKTEMPAVAAHPRD